jgi:hypothetical protein
MSLLQAGAIIMDDGGVADAFYTVLSVGIVVIAGLALSGVVLAYAGSQGAAVADQMGGSMSPGLKPGLYAFYYQADDVADLESTDPVRIPPGDFVAEGIVPALSINSDDLPMSAADGAGMVILAGNIYSPETGDYIIELASACGSWLWLDDKLILASPGIHPPAVVQSAPMHLDEGIHRVKVRYFYTVRDDALCNVRWSDGGPMACPACYH